MARWISGIILAVVVVLLLFYCPPVYLQYVLLFCGGVCAYELFTMAFARQVTLLWSGVILSILLVAVLTLPYFEGLKIGQQNFLVLFLGVLYFVFFMALTLRQPLEIRLKSVAVFFLFTSYCVLFFFYLVKLALIQNHIFWFFLLMACTFLADTGAYLVGKKWGKNKLAALVSPHKSWQGLAGGIVFAVVGSLAVNYFFTSTVPLWGQILFGMVLALFGLFGDLSESLIKRAFSCKDSSQLIPGHGGLLDRIDALLFNAPLVYYFALWSQGNFL